MNTPDHACGALSVRRFCKDYGISRTKTYAEIKGGRLKMKKLGTRSLIRVADAEAWLAALPPTTQRPH